jgi:hypothetical protein
MDAGSLATLVVATVAVFGLAIAAMAVGVVFSGRCLRGSCGGHEVRGPDGERLSCDNCPNRSRGKPG